MKFRDLEKEVKILKYYVKIYEVLQKIKGQDTTEK